MSKQYASASGHIQLHEGSIGLPPGFDDRSTNLFIPAKPQHMPNLGIARDWLNVDENLAAYVDRQLEVLKSRLSNHRALSRTTEQLGQGKVQLTGERIDARYRNGSQTIHQRQAAFVIAPQRVLIFTATSPRSFDDEFEALWRTWLDSFVHLKTGAGPV